MGPERKKTHRASATATFSTSDRQKSHPHCSHSHFSDFQCSDWPLLSIWIAYRNRTVAAEIPPFWTFDPALDASLQLQFYHESPSETHNFACRTHRGHIRIDASMKGPNFAFRSRNYIKIGDRPGPIFCDFISIMSASKSDMKPYRFSENA